VIEKTIAEKHEDDREHSHAMKESPWNEKSPS
jgi:hypothetical protein